LRYGVTVRGNVTSHGIQTVEHLMFQCKMLRNERAILKSSVLKEGKWPLCKCELTNRNL
jgi:hypothetical protein